VNVGYYYHVEAFFEDDGSVSVPAHHGMLLEGIASRAGEMTLYAHRAASRTGDDYVLRPPLVRPVDIGVKGNFPERLFRPRSVLRHITPSAHGVDVLLVQGPSPLLPHVAMASDVPSVLLLGGDYGGWIPRETFARHRNIAIWALLRVYARLQRRAASGRLALLQNPTLAESVRGAARTEVVPLSSLATSDLPPEPETVGWTDDAGVGRPLRLLYTGRIVREKGLFEAVEAVAILRDRGYDVTFDLVGGDDPKDPTVQPLLDHARSHGVSDRVRYLGYRSAGAELLAVYRDADAYVIPTYWDSVPRSMQEAMAFGLPVVAGGVGGIEHYLADGEGALLVRPQRPGEVADAVQRLIEDATLRTRVATNGMRWARGYTNDSSCDLIVRHLREWAGSSATQRPAQ
jgi:glycosyltransferase involved in cell wall biosynthesis